MLSAQKTEVEESIYSAFFDLQVQINSLKEERVVKARLLRSQNNALETPNIAASNERWVNRIVLNSIIKNEVNLTLNQSNKMKNIATQCVAEGGLAVYTARSIHDQITPGLQNDYRLTDQCYDNTEERSANDASNYVSNSEISIFPNPSSGLIHVQLKNKLDQGELLIYDVLGRVVHKETLSSEQIALELNLDKGVFFLAITEKDAVIRYEKIIIQ